VQLEGAFDSQTIRHNLGNRASDHFEFNDRGIRKFDPFAKAALNKTQQQVDSRAFKIDDALNVGARDFNMGDGQVGGGDRFQKEPAQIGASQSGIAARLGRGTKDTLRRGGQIYERSVKGLLKGRARLKSIRNRCKGHKPPRTGWRPDCNAPLVQRIVACDRKRYYVRNPARLGAVTSI
jgi:hypothetical protein